MNRFAMLEPATTAQAALAASSTVADAMSGVADAGGASAAIVKAGGIDILDLLKEELLAPGRLVNLRQVPGLDAVAETGNGGLRIGAMVSLARVAEHGAVRERFPALADAVRDSASLQIRHVATLGGNLLQRPRCWYFRSAEFRCLRKGGGHCYALDGENQYHAIFDNRPCAIVHPSTAATALVALGAILELVDARGAARRVRLEEFLVPVERDAQRENELRPHEILTAVELPAPRAGTRMAHLKVAEKGSFDWPLADVAVVLELAPGNLCRHVAIVLGAAAPVPHRARAAEHGLVGRRVDEDSARAAGRAAIDGATPLAKNAYKLPLFASLVARTLAKALPPA